jgi:hypothetical protein
MLADSSGIPSAGDLASKLLGAAVGGRRTSLNASQSQGTNVSVSPTIVNNIGPGSPQVSPSIGGASGSPYATGSAYAAGDTPGYLSTGSVRAVPGSMPGTVVPGAASQDWTMLALLAGAGVLAFMLWE